jgi:hypothetical protein
MHRSQCYHSDGAHGALPAKVETGYGVRVLKCQQFAALAVVSSMRSVGLAGYIASHNCAQNHIDNPLTQSVLAFGTVKESTVKCGQSCSHFGFGRRFQRRMPLLELGAQGAIEGSGSGLQHEVRASF